MSITSNQIGQSSNANLLWQISKQLNQLIKLVGLNNPSTTTTTTTL